MKEVDIQSLVQQAIDLLKESSRDKNLEICFEASTSIPSVYCQEQLLFRAIQNLLSNALKYTPEGGKVDVTVTSYLQWKDGGVVEISIKDTGIGILKMISRRSLSPFIGEGMP